MKTNQSNDIDKHRVPTVSRVTADTLVELVYDRDKRATALVVSRFDGLWNIEQEVKIDTGEVLVPYAASNNLIVNECVLLPSRPVEYGSKDELVADIRSYLHRYVDLSPLFEHIAAYYVLLTWVHDAFNELPYLRLRGEYGTGKTRGLLTIGSLCYKPFFASGASTTSPIFHTLNAFGGTLVLDEADLPFSDARVELVKILNNGTVKGMPVLRTLQNRYKEFNPYAFKVFGPKIIATRAPFQDRALESRFLTEETGSRPLRPDIPIHFPNCHKDEALELRNRLLHFRLEAFASATDAVIRHGGAVAQYCCSEDIIEMPDQNRFHGSKTSTPTETYYSTLLHELTHWSGAPHRLDRQFGDRFGGKEHAFEELIAELGAAFLCSSLGITNEPRPDHAAYVAHWLEILDHDHRAVFTAASKAQEAVRYLAQLAALKLGPLSAFA
ncbi:MAG TPA: zincin-like metallopeptidase domain-containing protein [Rhizomicrobium sp.]|jgi:hypothetical protein